MRDDLYLHPHIILGKPGHAKTGPDGLVVGHPFLEVPDDSPHSFVIDWYVISRDSKDLRPAFAPRVRQRQLHIFESLVNLCIDLRVENAGIWIETAYKDFLSISKPIFA